MSENLLNSDGSVKLEVSLQDPKQDYINMRIGSVLRNSKSKEDLFKQLEDLGTEVKRIDGSDTVVGKVKNFLNLP